MDYLAQTYYSVYETKEIQQIVEEFNIDALTKKEKARQLYLKVRDEHRYNPYYLNFSKEHFKSSNPVQIALILESLLIIKDFFIDYTSP